MTISRRRVLTGAGAAAVTGLTAAPLAIKAAGVKAALAGEEAQAIAVFRQLNPVRQNISITMMQTILKVQRANERNGFTTEDDAERALDLERQVAGMRP